MAKFSIMNTISYGFRTYLKHIVLLSCVAITLGSFSWAARMIPRWTAVSLGIYKPVVFKYQNAKTPLSAPIAQTSKSGIHAELYKVGQGIGETVTQKVKPYIKSISFIDVLMLLAVASIMIFLWLWIHIGAVRVFLDIKDKDKSSYDRLFSQRDLVTPYLFLTILYALLMICIVLGIGVGAAILEVILRLLLTDILGLTRMLSIVLAAAIGLVAMFIFVMRYIFAFYVLIDKKKGALQALSTSYDITKGNVFMLSVFLFIVTIPMTYSTRFVVYRPTFMDSFSHALVGHIFMAFLGIFYGLCFVHIYRQLSKAGKKA